MRDGDHWSRCGEDKLGQLLLDVGILDIALEREQSSSSAISAHRQFSTVDNNPEQTFEGRRENLN